MILNTGIERPCVDHPRSKKDKEFWRKEANWHSLPRHGQSLRKHLDRCPPVQANPPKLPVLPNNTIPSYNRGRKFEVSFQRDTLSRLGIRGGLDQVGFISPLLFSLCANDMPFPRITSSFPSTLRHVHVRPCVWCHMTVFQLTPSLTAYVIPSWVMT